MKKTLIAMLVCTSLYTYASAADILVNTTATGTPDGMTAETAYTSIQSAVDAAADGDTILVASGDYQLSSQLTLDKSITISGQGGVTIKPQADFGSDNATKHLINQNAVTVTLSGLTLDCDGKCYGLQVYEHGNLTLNGVSIINSKGAGLTVNGSTVTASGLTTSGNAWGAVNVDPGSGVTTPSVFTLTSGDLSESTKIWSDGAHVTDTATVTVNASSYTQYKVDGSSVIVWTNNLTNKAYISDQGTNTIYASIQAAIAAAQTGATVHVAPGTYTEQLLIEKNLTLSGDNAATTIINAPATLAAGVDGQTSIVELNNGASVTVSGLAVSGPGPSACGSISNGIFVVGTSTLTLSNASVTDIRDSALSGCQNGRAVRVGLSSNNQIGTATISNTTITGYQKSGIFVDGAGSSATITGSTITGVGSTPTIAQNGITFYNGATGTVTGSTISGNVYTGANSSAGILLYNQGSGVVIKNTTSTGNQLGIAVVGSTGATVENNNLGGNTEAGLDTEVALDASPNYWGSSSDPTTTNALATSTLATYSPWYTDASMTSFASTVSTSSTTATVTFASETQSSTTTSAGSVEVVIPSGTTISGPATWDGSFELPTIVTSSAVPSESAGNWLTPVSAIEIGASNVALTFDKPVKLTFAGQAGKNAGWIRNGVFSEILTTCDDAANPTLAAGADCKIDVGADLIVWTKHATTFVTLTKAAIPYGGGSGSSGASSGGVSSSVSAPSTQNVTPTQTPQIIVSVPTTPTQVGQVLGATSYAFSRNLGYGAIGDDVTELQKILIEEGYLKISKPTKWFGPLTKAALIKWQAKHGIPSTGFFGKLSQGFLLK